jgi:hypothetical protein
VPEVQQAISIRQIEESRADFFQAGGYTTGLEYLAYREQRVRVRFVFAIVSHYSGLGLVFLSASVSLAAAEFVRVCANSAI